MRFASAALSKKIALKRTNADPTPFQRRCFAVSEKFATFATVQIRPSPGGIVRGSKLSFLMSKGNMLLGHARGKVGDIVFSRVNGQQVTRARAAVVKNPKTEKQVIQRILLNTIIQAYSRMAEICDHSFEGVQVGSKSMAKFMRENINALRTKVSNYASESGTFEGMYAFAPQGLNVFTPNEYVIAKGQLPEVQLASISAANGAAIAMAYEDAIPTYAEIIASLGLQRGDQLTFVGQELYTDGRAAFKFARVILDPRETDGSQAELTEPFLVAGAVNKPSPRNEGTDITFSSQANKLIFDLGERSMFGAAVIVSREKSDGTWLRSNTTLALDPTIPYATVGAFDLQEAIDYSYAGGFDLESERYLNNATKGAKIYAPAPTPTPGNAKLTSVTIDGVASTKGINVPKNAGSVTIAAQASGIDPEAASYLFADSGDVTQGDEITITANNGVSIASGSATKAFELEAFGTLTVGLAVNGIVKEIWNEIQANV